VGYITLDYIDSVNGWRVAGNLEGDVNDGFVGSL
jgi:hypothetical protein